jgi:hypothetical protein
MNIKISKEAKQRNGFQLLGIIIVYIIGSIMEGTMNVKAWGYSDTLASLLVCLFICWVVNKFIDISKM